MNQKRECVIDYPQGNGIGVADALGNWGFSNGVSNPGQELNRLKCLFAKMDCLRGCKPMLCVKYDCRYDPQAWYVKPSPEICKPVWTFPINRPLITYNSVCDVHIKSNFNEVYNDTLHVMPGRSYVLQGTEKWYRRGPDCCPQPSCLAPQCPPTCPPTCPPPCPRPLTPCCPNPCCSLPCCP